MDTLVVVFTGLMIFDFANHKAYPIKTTGHKYQVQIGSGQPKEVTSIKFGNLATGSGSDPVQNFSLLSLSRVTGKELKLLATGFEPIDLKTAGILGPYLDFGLCTSGSYTVLSWRGVQWDAKVENGRVPTITLGMGGKEETITLTNLPLVRISNDVADEMGGGMSSHLPRYAAFITDKEGKAVRVEECKAGVFKDVAEIRKNNPVTCPPVSLR